MRPALTTQLAGEVLLQADVVGRATALVAEVLLTADCIGRATALAVEVLRLDDSQGVVTALAGEVLRSAYITALVTALTAEVLRAEYGRARATALVAEVLRTPSGRARATALIAEILRESVDSFITHETVRPWPFRANAQFEITETYGYLSEVLRSRNGAEQRRSLRDTAGGEVSFTCTILDDHELQYAMALLGALMGSKVGVPLWQYAQRLTAGCSLGATTISADTATVPFYAGAPVILWQSPWDWEIAWVDTVVSGSLQLEAGLTHAWSALTTILLPLVFGYFKADREEATRFSLAAGDFPVEFDVPAYFP